MDQLHITRIYQDSLPAVTSANLNERYLFGIEEHARNYLTSMHLCTSLSRYRSRYPLLIHGMYSSQRFIC